MKLPRPLIAGLLGTAIMVFAEARPTASASDPAKTPKVDVTVGDAEDGKTIHIKANQTLEVRLASNITTGYSWYAVGGRDNDGKASGNMEVGVLAPSGEHEYVADRVPKGTVGGGGADVFRYYARKPGTATLRFIYMRPWEKGEIDKRESFKVVVE